MGLLDLIRALMKSQPSGKTVVRQATTFARADATLTIRDQGWESRTVNRNLKGIDLERQGREDAAIKCYEANVADNFDGSHPYERLMIIYGRRGMAADAQRIARACLVQATAGLSDKLRQRCQRILSGTGDPSTR